MPSIGYKDLLRLMQGRHRHVPMPHVNQHHPRGHAGSAVAPSHHAPLTHRPAVPRSMRKGGR